MNENKKDRQSTNTNRKVRWRTHDENYYKNKQWA